MVDAVVQEVPANHQATVGNLAADWAAVAPEPETAVADAPDFEQAAAVVGRKSGSAAVVGGEFDTSAVMDGESDTVLVCYCSGGGCCEEDGY